jgi:hypothetical protein
MAGAYEKSVGFEERTSPRMRANGTPPVSAALNWFWSFGFTL